MKKILMFFCLIVFVVFYAFSFFVNLSEDEKLKKGLRSLDPSAIEQVEQLISTNKVGSFDHDKWKTCLCNNIPSHNLCGGGIVDRK